MAGVGWNDMKANGTMSVVIGLISIVVMTIVASVVQSSLRESYIQYHYRTNDFLNTDVDIKTWTSRLDYLARMSWTFYIYPLLVIVTTTLELIRKDNKSYNLIVVTISMICFVLSMGAALYIEMDIWKNSFGRIL